jgi:hypothetical protein
MNFKKSIEIDKLQLCGYKKKWFIVMESWSDYLTTLNEKDTKTNDKGKKNCEYIYDIFRGIKERDFLMCVTKEFIILPSAAKPFEELDKNHFNLLVIPFDKKLRTIRDLDSSHIPLLNKMVKKVYEVLDYYLGEYDKNNLRFEFHYTPSTYHLHLHCQFNPILHDNTKRHYYYNLEDIITNIKSNSNFYKKPIKIKVKNINDWKNTLKKYSVTEITFESASGVEDFSNAYKDFIDMDAYKLFN